jgi:EAL and modified HD-GYP domain-containing signal transduction protein
MENVLLGRQPIFAGDMNVLGYELLFRQDSEEHALVTDGSLATADVLNRCAELGLQDIVGRELAFINFGRQFLLNNYCEALPHQQAVLEVLETVDPDAEILGRLKELRGKGYRVALDDFVCVESAMPLLRVADFVKLDILALSEADLKQNVAVLRKFPVRIIAEKVETHEQFQLCKDIGFDYFQGYFFCRPHVIRGRRVPVNRLATIRLITKLNDPNLPIKELEQTIAQDVALSYKLLLYVNSAVCGLHRHVESIGHATMLIGHAKLKIWASLILFSRLDDKPPDLIITGLVRARMCENIAQALRLDQADRCFLAGLFSVLDAILDQPLEQILSGLPLTPDVREALLEQKGRFGSILRSVMAYERQEWSNITCGHLDLDGMRKTYVEAMTSVLKAFGAIVEPKSAHQQN